ncbi:MAG: phosphoesterase, partial [Thermoplasmata archaeon]|nr:phosphoesterase [Thermoplasmata archaeon]
DRLLILGDLKHTIAFATRLEYFGLSRFFKSLAERYSQIDVIAGNHDGGLQKHIPSDVNYHGSSGIAIDKVGLTHGHSWPSQGVMKSNKIVFAHIHPSVRLTDRMGTGNSVKVWLRGKVHRDRLMKRYPKISVEESIIMPAFNHLITGSPVNENKNPVSNPLMKSGFVNISDNHAYTLEGIDLGAVAALLKEKTRNVR